LAGKDDKLSTLVVDTSAVINLYASKHGEAILSALPAKIIIPQMVSQELEKEASRSTGESDFVKGLACQGLVTIADMSDEEAETFLELTSIYPTLDDGEAATIAIAVSRNFIPVLDERKGRKRAAAMLMLSVPWWSIDLFRHSLVVDALGDKDANEALFLALFRGRMRIPAEQAGLVIDLIGVERAKLCTCLPNYSKRFS
jgi:predicted nucleic acid-binding protein